MSLQDELFKIEKNKKDLESESCPITQDTLISKLENMYKSSQEKSLSLSESVDFCIPSSTLFSSKQEEKKNLPSPLKNDSSPQIPLTQKALLNSFNTQKTTMILQQVLFEASKDDIENIVNELFGKYRQIIKDKNGNYFCSDLFKVCDQKQRIKILNELTNTICDDCVDKFGTHPIQTLIEFSSCEEEYNLLLNSFNDYNKLLFAAINPNGSYVITKIIEHIPEKFRMNFNLLFVRIICFICTKKFGVCNAKKFVACTKNEEILRKLIDLIKDNFVSISSNDYGNYLIQYIMEKWWNTNEGEEIKEQIKDNFQILAGNKYSSFIIELFLRMSSKEDKMQLIKRISANSNNNINAKNIDNILIMRIMKSIGQPNAVDNKNKNNFNFMNNNNNFINNNNNFINNNQIPLLLNNFGNNNAISNNIPISLNNFNNNQNMINKNQLPLSLNNFNINNNILNNNKKDNFYNINYNMNNK